MAYEDEIPPDRNSQISLLFEQDKSMGKDIVLMKQTLDNQQTMINGINKSLKALEELQKDSHLVLFGNKDLNVKGLIQKDQEQDKTLEKQDARTGKLEQYAWKGMFVLGFIIWAAKEFGWLDKLMA